VDKRRIAHWRGNKLNKNLEREKDKKKGYEQNYHEKVERRGLKREKGESLEIEFNENRGREREKEKEQILRR
jgi:hypothetical protein